MDLTKVYRENPVLLKAILAVETVGLLLLLIPTGGIESPFIWYALNPVLLAGSFLSSLFSWGILVFFLTISTSIYIWLFNEGKTIGATIGEYSYFYIVLALMTIFIQLFSRLVGEINHQNRELTSAQMKLKQANMKKSQALEHLMGLYEIVETFNFHNGINGFIKAISDYSQRILNGQPNFIWVSTFENKPESILANSHPEILSEHVILQLIDTDNVGQNSEPTHIRSEVGEFFIIGFKTIHSRGIIGVKCISDTNDYPLIKRHIQFIKELCTAIIDRHNIELVNEQLMLTEEKFKATNEIHDKVHQLLFSILCSMQGIKGQKEDWHKNENFISIIDSVKHALKELKSSSSDQTENLTRKLKQYLSKFSLLNEIEVDYEIAGVLSLLPIKIQKLVYKSVCQLTGISVRRGESTKIHLILFITDDCLTLNYKDNGLGHSSNYNDDYFEQVKLAVGSENGEMAVNVRGDGIELNIIFPIKSNIKEAVT
ncbi:hypothetical protein LC048_00225 [Mesobacillus subterraneus]|uniref:hypothetical protein n=1 Tax=Mesobacillus subterraneus TaxID=285983 RepID=UPI00273D2189|nr:hypothetical protein [Mesobacillus subterraneus]WLR55489.1 hypothetical protein LC048_00225 [Mesobacillus subterraneus]